MLGFQAAKNVVTLGRSAFFSSQSPDLPVRQSIQLQVDDLAPQFGFVGTKYAATRILLLGINPGNGGRDDRRIPEDERMMPAVLRFAQMPTEANFEAAASACLSEIQNWRVWRSHCSAVIGAGKLQLFDVAYTNCLPWRTQSKSRFSDAVARNAVDYYLRPFIEEAQPRLIIAMGKERVPEILKLAGWPLAKTIVWNRSQAATAAALRERAEAAAQVFRFIQTMPKSNGA